MAAATVLGDGAEWIWNLAEQRFSGASQCLDSWHAAGHLGDGAREAFGTGAEAEAALDLGKRRLLEDGYWGVSEWIGELAIKMPAGISTSASTQQSRTKPVIAGNTKNW